MLPFALCILATVPAPGAAHLLILGDSLSKEYEISFPGVPLAGVAGLDAANPGARNWNEILASRRNVFFDQGTFKSSVFAPWTDLRLLGHEYNWAVPGADSRQLRDLLTGQNLNEISDDPSFSQFIALASEWPQSSARITAQLQAAGGAAGAVIFIGGNDLNSGSPDPAASVNGNRITYGTIYAGDGTGVGDPQPLMNSILSNIQQIATFVRDGNPTIPLAICAVPHVGATPDVKSKFPTDTVRTGRVTTALHTLNAQLKTWTETTVGGVWVDTPQSTFETLITTPLTLGGIRFETAADPLTSADSPSAHTRYLFAKDGFHATTVPQALLARDILDKMRAAYPAVYGAAAPLTTREILVDVCGLPAMTGFNEYLADQGVDAGKRGPLDDPDADGVPNLVEFALAGKSAGTSDAGTPATQLFLDTSGAQPVLSLEWTPRFADNIACSITCQASGDLATWVDVPESVIVTSPSGTRTASAPLPEEGKAYLRLKITATP